MHDIFKWILIVKEKDINQQKHHQEKG